MGQGRGISAIMLLFCLLLLYSESEKAHANNTYVVGDNAGWTYDIINWPSGKTFKAGDILVFNYNPMYHNVVIVDEGGYRSCYASRGSKTYQSGHDHIQLTKGENFFICSFPGHCNANMKIAVNAA